MSTLEDKLYEKAVNFLKDHKGVRENKTEDIFERKLLIVSDEDIVINNYLRRRPKLAFNPGAILDGDTLHIFPRLIFDYYTYTSSIGLFSIKIENVIEGKVDLPVNAKILIWPKFLWEFRGCEDPRVFKDGNRILMLYTGYGYFLENNNLSTSIVQAFAELDEKFNEKRRGYFKIKSEKDSFVPRSSKDSAFLKVSNDEALILTRPLVNNLEIGWYSKANLNELFFYENSMKPSLWFEDWEFKVGWSTNAIKISSNEYLIGWHGVLKEDYSYRNGLALLNEEGEVVAISNYLLSPRGINEEYGDRPKVIFGNGLIRYKDLLVWIGGVSDYAIEFFVTEIDKAMEKLKWIRRLG